MIKTRDELNAFLDYEKRLYMSESSKDKFLQVSTAMPDYELWKYIRLLRITEFHYNNRTGNGISSMIHALLYLIYRRRKNRIGTRLGIEIWENSFDIGLRIYHSGNIIINGMSRIGKNCQLHGDNCIGNDGKTFDAPSLGDNVEVGAGASIIGNVKVCDNVVIGAGAVVIKSIMESGTYAGIPAKLCGGGQKPMANKVSI